MSQPFRPLATSLDQRRNDVARTEGMAGTVHTICGFIEVAGAGEVAVPVSFPVRFIEKPAFSFGGELAEGQLIEDTNFPTVSGVVQRWNFGIRDDSGARFYDGAIILIVSTGMEKQRLIFHYQMEGKALRNPLNNLGGGLGGTI